MVTTLIFLASMFVCWMYLIIIVATFSKEDLDQVIDTFRLAFLTGVMVQVSQSS